MDIRYVEGEEFTIQDADNREERLGAGDHFHQLKAATDERGLNITFSMSTSKKFKNRHYDGFYCLVTCVVAICPKKLDRN